MEPEKSIIQSRSNNGDNTINVKITRTKKETHNKKYNVRKFLNPSQFSFSEKIKELIPTNVLPFIDTEENYIERTARALAIFKQCGLVGPSGTGKTHIAYLVAEFAGLPLWEINSSLQTSVFDLFGKFIGLGKENWIDGPVTSWCKHGGILYLDEANMLKQDVAARLNSILDQRGHLVLTEKDNETIPRHKDAFVIISMNPVSSEFAGTKPLNVAIKRRLNVWITFDYMSIGSKTDTKEINLVVELTGIGKEVASKMVMIAATLRGLYKSGEIQYAPSVGDLANWARLINHGATFNEGAEETIIALAGNDPEEQKMVRRLIDKMNEIHPMKINRHKTSCASTSS